MGAPAPGAPGAGSGLRRSHLPAYLDGLKLGADAFLPAVLQAVAQPICVVDGNGRIRFANSAAIAALGYDDAHELLGRQSHEALHGTPASPPQTTGETVTRELDWFCRRDGSMFPVAYLSVPLDMPGGSGALVAFTDTRAPLRADPKRERESRLAEQQDSLRRVAALAAQGAPAAEVFATVAEEVARVMHLPLVAVCRYDGGGAAITVIGEWGARSHAFAPGTRWPIGGASVSAQVLRTGRPARIDDGAELPGSIAGGARESGVETVAGAPIVVDGRVWGVMAAASPDAPIPDGVEDRLADFTTLVAIAISNTQAREDLRGLADEQAALRRVATLVAEGAMPADVFAAVAREVAAVMQLPMASVGRYDDDGAAVTVVGAGGDRPGLFQAGRRWPLDGPSIAERVLRTGRPARFEDYTGIPGTIADACRRIGFQAGVGAPIVVDGELWGLVGAGADPGRSLPADAERRLSQFTALAATAISNSQAREDLRGLADVQAALRRVAMLVAEGATPADVFAAVAREVALVLKLPMAGMYRYEPDGTVSVVGARGGHAFQPGTNWPLDGPSLASLVRRTGRPGSIDDYTEVPGTIGEAAARSGIRAGVGAPIVVDGELWGIVGAGAEQGELVPPDAERRLSQFTALVAAAISNMQAREELLASRVRIVEAADEQRRRVVRDLHDGAQERMIHAIFALQRAHDRDDAPPDVRSLVEEGVTHVRSAIRELRELAHGIHPEILTQQGLAAAVQPLADRAPLPVDIDIPDARYPTPVESAAYFVAAEALTNVAKYARASTARITGTRTPAGLSLVVEDDGIGGAKRMAGRGLAGLGDRLAALHGALTVDSPPRGGTRIRAEIPLAAGAGPTRASGLPE